MARALKFTVKTIVTPPKEDASDHPGPSCKTPKRLKIMASDALALYMLPKILLPLRKLFAGRIHAPMDGLKALKTWYWSEKRLGSYDSNIRQLMSRSFIDALDHLYGEFSFKATRGYAVQLLFCCEVGHLQSMPHCQVEPIFSYHLAKLVEFMAPLYITGLHDTCLAFPRPVFLLGCIMQNSPYLKTINFMQSLSDIVLCDLSTKCRQVQVLKLDVFLPTAGVDQFANFLCLVFFDGLTSIQVKERFQKMEPIPLTFGNLLHFHLRYDVLPGTGLVPFFECVLNCYQNLTIELGNAIAWPFAEAQFMKEPLLSPSLIIDHRKFGWKRATMCFWSSELTEWEYIVGAKCAYFHSCSDFLNRILELFDQLHESFYSVKELEYIYCRTATPYVTVNIHKSFGATLKELLIYGVIKNRNDLGALIRNLNECPNLKTLYLSLVMRSLDVITDLKPLCNLQSLSVNFNSIEEERETEIHEEREFLKLFLPLMRAAPNLQMLEMPGSTCLSDLTAAGLLPNIRSLSLKCWKNLQSHELFVNLCRLQNLKVLIINQSFGYLKYVHLKRMLRYTDLEIIFNKQRLVQS